jgi:hypothetical protein
MVCLTVATPVSGFPSFPITTSWFSKAVFAFLCNEMSLEIIASLHHCIIALLHYCIIALLHYCIIALLHYCIIAFHGVSNIHGLPKVSLGPAKPYQSTPCGRPSLKQPYYRLWSDRPKGWRPAAVLILPWIPHATWTWLTSRTCHF